MVRRLRLSYEQLQLLTLLALALIPILVFSLIATGRIDLLVNSTANQSTRTTLDAVMAVVRQREAELSNSAESYATWDQLRSHAAAADATWLRDEALGFVVNQGIADAAVFRLGPLTVASGDTGAASDVEAELATVWRGEARTVDFARPDGIYSLALWPVEPLATGQPPGVIAFARRLDEHFVSDAQSMTGWDVAVAGALGQLHVATRLDPFVRLGTPSAAGAAAGAVDEAGWTRQAQGLTGGAAPLLGPDGRPIGAVLAVTDIGAVAGASNQVLTLLGLTLLPTIAGALVLSLLLTFWMRRRLQTIEHGIAAVAAGDLSVRFASADRGGFERLASSHNRLAAALERRDRTLSRLLATTASLPANDGVVQVARDGVAAVPAIFGIGWCELRAEDGSVLAATERPAISRDGDGDGGHDPGVAEHAVGFRGWSLQYGGTPASWSRADEDLFGVFAGQLGSALRDAEEHERAANRADALDRNYRLQSDFLRGVSHNLQSPLTAIVGLSDELRDAAALDAPARDRAEVIHAEAERLTRLVRQLLTLSRLEAGTLAVEAEVCAIEPIVARAWRAQRSQRELLVENRAGSALAVADAQALEQVLWILFDNAVHYAPTGPIRVSIAIAKRKPSARRPGLEVAGQTSADQFEMLVRIEDEGPGVPPGERRAIFGRFQRGSTSTGHEGTGLGLDVARGLLRAMDGRIFYEPGRVGAAFVVAVPAEVVSLPV